MSVIVTTKKRLLDAYPEYHCNVWDYIDTGYRLPTYSFTACLHSLFMIHNELVNVWTHLLGMYFTIACLPLASRSIPTLLYFSTGIVMFCTSACYHLFSCHSIRVCRTCQLCDWTMISGLIFASNMYCSYHELYINGNSPNLFLVFNTINFILMILSAHMTRHSLQQMYRKDTNTASSYAFRTCVYMLYASGCMIAWLIQRSPDTLQGLLTMYACYMTVLFCLFDFPEKYVSRNGCDILGHSHQILHIGTTCGYLMLWKTYE